MREEREQEKNGEPGTERDIGERERKKERKKERKNARVHAHILKSYTHTPRRRAHIHAYISRRRESSCTWSCTPI